ncbi:MAG: hypothetical protein JSV91_13045 [Phycisphaerales bacterium]|nr:MAG: hypothetical protein JSV91_13045 [Phycisphaerales bacterium]
MAIINDRDLLLIEPSLYVDAAGAGTVLTDGTDGAVLGTSFSSAGSNFVSLDIDAGHVIVIDGEACEVIERVSMTALDVSAPRASLDDPLIAPGDGTGLVFSLPSFGRIIDQAQAWTFGALGIDPDHPTRPLDESAIINPDPVKRFIALRAVRLAFAAAAALDPTSESLAERSSLYHRRCSEAMHNLNAMLDLNGDGVVDTARRIDVVNLSRV